MEVQLAKATKFLIEDVLGSDFKDIADVQDRRAFEDQARGYFGATEDDIAGLKWRYGHASGIC
jgi:hypothetical protein